MFFERLLEIFNDNRTIFHNFLMSGRVVRNNRFFVERVLVIIERPLVVHDNVLVRYDKESVSAESRRLLNNSKAILKFRAPISRPLTCSQQCFARTGNKVSDDVDTTLVAVTNQIIHEVRFPVPIVFVRTIGDASLRIKVVSLIRTPVVTQITARLAVSKHNNVSHF